MTGTEQLVVGDVVPHAFYGVFTYSPGGNSVQAADVRRAVSRADFDASGRLAELALHTGATTLEPWPYLNGVERVFSPEAKRVLEGHAESADAMAFVEQSLRMGDGRHETVFVAIPTSTINVLSRHSTVRDHGGAVWWALELRKLANRTFFPVPGAEGTTVMRGDLVLALHELGWPCRASELRVLDGEQIVRYDEWAHHPEWTGYASRP